MDLHQLEGWAFDLDGVVYEGERLLDGAADLVTALREAGRRVVFVTNNSGASQAFIAQKLTRLGIPATADQVVSAVSAAGEYLRERYGAVRVLVSGTPAVVESMAAAGHTPVTDPAEAEAVVMGRDPQFSYAVLTTLCRAVDRGIPFLALNVDRRFPVEDGWLPGLGALAAAVATATGRQPEVVGKPSPLMFRSALAHLGTEPVRSVMLGDTPEVDVAGARAAGMWTILIGHNEGDPPAHLRAATPREILQHLWKLD